MNKLSLIIMIIAICSSIYGQGPTIIINEVRVQSISKSNLNNTVLNSNQIVRVNDRSGVLAIGDGITPGGTLINGTFSNNKLLFVSGQDSPTENGQQLLNAYITAKTKSPSISNEVSIVLAPGDYNIGTNTLVLDTPYINIFGQLSADIITKGIITTNTYSKKVSVLSGIVPKSVIKSSTPTNIAISTTAGNVLVCDLKIDSCVLTSDTSTNIFKNVWFSEYVDKLSESKSMFIGCYAAKGICTDPYLETGYTGETSLGLCSFRGKLVDSVITGNNMLGFMSYVDTDIVGCTLLGDKIFSGDLVSISLNIIDSFIVGNHIFGGDTYFSCYGSIDLKDSMVVAYGYDILGLAVSANIDNCILTGTGVYCYDGYGATIRITKSIIDNQFGIFPPIISDCIVNSAIGTLSFPGAFLMIERCTFNQPVNTLADLTYEGIIKDCIFNSSLFTGPFVNIGVNMQNCILNGGFDAPEDYGMTLTSTFKMHNCMSSVELFDQYVAVSTGAKFSNSIGLPLSITNSNAKIFNCATTNLVVIPNK